MGAGIICFMRPAIPTKTGTSLKEVNPLMLEMGSGLMNNAWKAELSSSPDRIFFVWRKTNAWFVLQRGGQALKRFAPSPPRSFLVGSVPGSGLIHEVHKLLKIGSGCRVRPGIQ